MSDKNEKSQTEGYFDIIRNTPSIASGPERIGSTALFSESITGDLCNVWSEWRKGTLGKRLNKRQICVLNMWTACLEEIGGGGYELMSIEIPNKLEELWELSLI